ncbi:Holliday junction resolvase RuvX [Candidatus Woesebacteria bacterium]|nr:Holliday junction resolvase RuvX [Candidatus Woesebacteria bacterium]
MRILGIDYGKRKMGLSIAAGKLAEPHSVVKVNSDEEAQDKIGRVVREEGIEKIVVGVSEGKMGKDSELFGKKLKEDLGVPVEFEDETLSSRDSQRLSIAAGLSRKKRKELEDAFAAAVMLQSYLERR